MAIPQLSPEERKAALEKAKAARIKRAEVREDLKRREEERDAEVAAELAAAARQ